LKKDVWKVKTIIGHERLFEQLCVENNIIFKPYPKPHEGLYRVECPKDKLLDIGYCIATIEKMPKVTLSREEIGI
jgi:hypothetical protein